MGKGVFVFDQLVTLIPKPHVLEAAMRIMGREFENSDGAYIVQEFAYPTLYIDQRGLLDADLLHGPFGMSYKAYRTYCLGLNDQVAVLSGNAGR